MDFILTILLIFLLVLQEVLLDQGKFVINNSDSETLIKALKSIEPKAETFSKRHAEEFELAVVEKMAEYQMQMVYHFNHSFEINDDNDKWTACLYTKDHSIVNIKEGYRNNSINCSRLALKKLREAQLGVSSILKQVRGWQKGYRYLKKLCKEENENITARETCLVQNLATDKYTDTLLNLLQYLENSETYLETSSEILLKQLDECLQDIFSQTITEIRQIMTALNKCYEVEVRDSGKSLRENRTEIVGELKRKSCRKNP